MSDPVTPRTYALLREFAGTSAALIVVSFGLLSARVLQRFSQRIKFKIDDWLLNAAWVLACIWWGMQFTSLAKVATPHHPEITSVVVQNIFRWWLISYPFWCVAMFCIKTSVLVTLLRIKDSKWWKLFLHALIVVQVIYTVGDLIAEWVFFRTLTTIQCAESTVDPCWKIYLVLNYMEAGYPIVTDVILSILPVTFLVQLRRPLREKIFIGLLMSLGLFASAFSVMKMVINTHWTNPNESLIDLCLAFYTYSSAELFVGIIAAGLFSLKSAFSNMLKKFGFDLRRPITTKQSDDLPDFNISIDSAAPLEATS